MLANFSLQTVLSSVFCWAENKYVNNNEKRVNKPLLCHCRADIFTTAALRLLYCNISLSEPLEQQHEPGCTLCLSIMESCFFKWSLATVFQSVILTNPSINNFLNNVLVKKSNGFTVQGSKETKKKIFQVPFSVPTALQKPYKKRINMRNALLFPQENVMLFSF